MDSTPLQIQMLGGFSICRGGASLNISGRSRKLCLLLAYLICERERPVPWEELIGLLWEGQDQGPNPLNALKAVLHRTRACLDRLGDGLGRTLILNREGCCQWNTRIPLVLDWEEFLRLCRQRECGGQEEQLLTLGLESLSLYQGSFLPTLAGCPWAAARAKTLHQLFLQTALDVLPLLAAQEQWDEAASLAGRALALEPCHEELCRRQMEALLRLDRRQESAQVYEAFQEQLLSQLGLMPSDQLRELYRQTQDIQDPRAISPATLLERLREPAQPGALLCDFDFFRVVCHSMARRAGRGGEPLHIALISLSGRTGSSLARYSLDRAMDHLQNIILEQLRRGDSAARCSASQFVLLLPQASYANSRLVCERIQKAFTRQFPHSPASLQISVQPMLPNF